MELYKYKGISAGAYVEGDVEASDINEASSKLKEKRIIITSLKAQKKRKKKIRKNQILQVFHLVKKKLPLKM